MRVRDVMARDPVTLNENDRLDLADDIMTLGRIRHLPVIRDDMVIGIISQRDLFRAAASSSLQLRRTAQHTWLERIGVRDMMSTPAITVLPEADIREAIDIMVRKRIGCLPVVTDEGRCVGLLSETDCMRVLAKILENASTRQQMAELVLD
jgi:CBS domain-containing protein